jgi:hypothetical protein
MTRQRQVVVRSKDGEGVSVYHLHDGGEEHKAENDSAVTPDTLLQIFLEPWVGPGEVKATIAPGNAVRFDLPDWTTTVTERAAEPHHTSPPTPS